VSFLLTPLMRIVALYYGVIDRPDNVRKMHTVPIAYLGGIAVFVGWLAGLAASQFLSLHRLEVGWPTTVPIVKFSIVIAGSSSSCSASGTTRSASARASRSSGRWRRRCSCCGTG
jgi:UDP-N-acetylmuramyl pentapeptide phosphotransferase/UDP-N-acetylglucosamine-1-phosphate transferase